MKTAKKALVLFLTLVMCLSLVPAAAFAEKPVYKVVAVGDSTCVGVGLDDYGIYTLTDYITSAEGYHYNYPEVYGLGFLEYGSKDAYPARLARYLQEKMPDREVKFTNLGVSGIRANEILALIDPDYEIDGIGKSFLTNHVGIFDRLCGESVYEFFTREIASADLITLDCVMNSFTGCLLDRLFAIMDDGSEETSAPTETLADLADRLSPGAKKLINDFREKFIAATGLVLPQSKVKAAADAVTYCFLDFCVTFSQLVDRIRELNPNAKLLVGGAYSPIHFLKISYEGIELDVGSLLSAATGIVNTYMTGIAPQRSEYSFINIPLDIETFRDYLSGLDSVWDLPHDFLRRLIDDSFGSDHSYLATPICTRGRAEAVERGLDVTDYYPIYPDMMLGYFEDVRENGENAPEVTKILVGLYSRALDLIIKSMKMTVIDVSAALEASSALNENVYSVLLKYMDRDYDELSEVEKTELFFAVMADPLDGIMPHFSYAGCALKYELAVKALEKGGNKLMQTENILDSARQNVKNGILSSLTSVLKNVLASIDFADFFASIAENIHQFFVRLLPTC